MAKKTQQPPTATPEPGGTGKSRKRNEYLLLVRYEEEGEFQELVTLSNQQDCKRVASMIRALLAGHDIRTDDWNFTLRVVKQATEMF